MNYNKIYNQLIEKAKIRQSENRLSQYKEIHHIIPRQLGGTDDKDNLVELTAREHYIAHLLLVKIYKNTSNYYKLVKAYFMMSAKSYSQERNYHINSRLYERLKIDLSKQMSLSQTGQGNSQYNTKWIRNFNTGEQKKIYKFDKIPDGFTEGKFDINTNVYLEQIKPIRELVLNSNIDFSNPHWRDELSLLIKYDKAIVANFLRKYVPEVYSIANKRNYYTVEEKKNYLLNSNIDFSNISEISKLLGCSDSYSKQFLRKNFPDIYSKYYETKHKGKINRNVVKSKQYKKWVTDRRLKNIQIKIEKILNSNIDFSEYGWISKLAKYLNHNKTYTKNFVMKYMPNHFEKSYKLSDDNLQYSNRKEFILNSGIDFSKYGWVSLIQRELNISQSSVIGFMKKHMTDFYKNHCYKNK